MQLLTLQCRGRISGCVSRGTARPRLTSSDGGQMSHRIVHFLAVVCPVVVGCLFLVANGISPQAGSCLWAEEPRERAALHQTDYVSSVTFSPDGKTLAVSLV